MLPEGRDIGRHNVTRPLAPRTPQEDASAASDGFMTASTNLATGLGQIAGQAAVKRLQDASNAQVANMVNTVA